MPLARRRTPHPAHPRLHFRTKGRDDIVRVVRASRADRHSANVPIAIVDMGPRMCQRRRDHVPARRRNNVPGAGWRWVSAPTAGRRSSTSAWLPARAPASGNDSSPISTAAGSPARGSRRSAPEPAPAKAGGGQGLIAALSIVYPGIPPQRRWAHKIRNVLDKVRRPDRDAVKAGLHAIMNAANRTEALGAARRFADACLRNDLDDLLTCFRYPTQAERKQDRITNAIERRFREVRRGTRPMGTFQDRTSMDRILCAVFSRKNKAQGISIPFSLTHNP